MEPRLILVNLLIKLGVAASAASILGSSVEFKSLLFREERTLAQKIYLVLWIGFPIALGVWIRFIQKSFFAGDLSFETTILLGVIGGRFTGMLGGALLSPPALLARRVGHPALCAALRIARRPATRTRPRPRRNLVVFAVCRSQHLPLVPAQSAPAPPLRMADDFLRSPFVALRFLQTEMHRLPGHATFSLESPTWWVGVLIYATSIMVIGIELKIWNSVRMQIKLEEQERLLLHARMEALQNQINPHFLFNTLNSVSSLVRFDPDTARQMIIKLANILRRLLHSSDAFVPLREELEFIDDYLDIEVVRFGRDKLHVLKELAPDSLDTMVPSMLLQPLVENSHQARPVVEDRGGQHSFAQPARGFPSDR